MTGLRRHGEQNCNDHNERRRVHDLDGAIPVEKRRGAERPERADAWRESVGWAALHLTSSSFVPPNSLLSGDPVMASASSMSNPPLP